MTTIADQEIYSLRSRINRLEAQVDYLYRHLGVTFVEDEHSTDDTRVIEALKTNNEIIAIKFYREAHNVGLAAAKAAVDEMRARLGL